VTAGPAAAASHAEVGDAGQTRATSQAPTADPLPVIRGLVVNDTADMYRVCSTGGAWSASTSATTSTDRPDGEDPELWLFNAAGDRIAFNDDLQNDDEVHIRESLISGDAAAGTYYLAIAQWPYGFDAHSADSWEMSDPHPGHEYSVADMSYTINVAGLRSCDAQAPHITTSATTADDEPYTAGDWTNQNVTVAFACVDNDGGSGVDDEASRLTASKTVSADGQHSVSSSGTCVDNDGNRAEAVSYDPVRIDKTAPNIERTDRTAANAAGWNAGDVTVTWSCTDAASGVVDDSISRTVSGDGADQVVSTTCRDRVGNSASATEAHINIDTHNPHITTSARTADDEPYSAGDWTNQNVTVAFACVDNDGGSGVDDEASRPTASETVSDEGVTDKVASSGDCVDEAGNRAEAGAYGAVKIDKTKPAIGASARTADDAAYAAGSWTNQNVTVAFSCADGDGGSGVDEDASDPTATRNVSDEGQHSVASSETCADNAGNSADAASFEPVRIDKTRPVLAFTGERTYTADEQVEIGCSATDALSGVAVACTGLSAPANTYAPGTHTITRSATDNAGNETRASATFTVKASPSSLCALTKRYVRSSAKYTALSPIARNVPDALVVAACQPLAAIVPGITPQAKAALVMTYKVAVIPLTYGGWLTAAQASELKTLAGAL